MQALRLQTVTTSMIKIILITGFFMLCFVVANRQRPLLDLVVLVGGQVLLIGLLVATHYAIKNWWSKGYRKEVVEKQLLNRLMIAAADGDDAKVATLLSTGENVNAQGKSGETALMFAVRNNHISTAKLLINHGADLNAKTELGSTALDIAKKKSNADVVKMLNEVMKSSNF